MKKVAFSVNKKLEDAFMAAYDALNDLEVALYAQYRETKDGAYLDAKLKVFDIYGYVMKVDSKLPDDEEEGIK